MTLAKMKGVIIAAGMGSRLWDVSNQIPKTLLPLAKGTILSTIITQLIRAGIHEIIVVVGYNKEYIIDYINKNQWDVPVSFIENNEWNRGNMLSVYAVKDIVKRESFLLSMSDHIVSCDALKKIINSTEDTNLLLVDPWLDNIFDMDDATKVYQTEDYIEKIGKEINGYNAVDCGIFRLERDFFDAAEEALGKQQESISAAITQLVAKKRIKTVPVSQPNEWQDIDTPEAYEQISTIIETVLR